MHSLVALHSTWKVLRSASPALIENDVGLGAGYRCVSNVNASFASPPWLTLTIVILLYVA